jgi:glycosyltransferase involved in cell wall biosynthesis
VRVLQVSDFYPPVIGGLERHLQTLSRSLVAHGHDVSIMTMPTRASPAFEYDEGVAVHRVAGWNRALAQFYDRSERMFQPPAPDPGVVRKLGALVREFRPDVVHARGWMLYSCIAWHRQDHDPPLVATLHDYGSVCVKKTLLRGGSVCSGPAWAKCVRCASDQYGPLKSPLLTTALHGSARWHRRVDQWIAISTAVREACEHTRLGTMTPIEVIPSFVPDVVGDPPVPPPRPDFLPAGDYLLFVGALGNHKGLGVLLDAYVGLHNPPPLVMIGSPQPDTPQELPAGVFIHRDVPHPEVIGAWAHCRVGLVPSLWAEPFGQVAVEGLASGRPVVASAIGGLTDIIEDGISGRLVPAGDAGALRDAVRTLLGESSLADRLGAAGRERARQFTASAIVPRIEAVYRRVASGAS